MNHLFNNQVRDLQSRVADSASERHAHKGADFFAESKIRVVIVIHALTFMTNEPFLLCVIPVLMIVPGNHIDMR